VKNNDFALFVFRSSAQLLLGSRRDPTITSAYTKGVGKLQIQCNNKTHGDRSHNSNVISEDEFSSMYDIRQTLGTGAYGEVKLVVHRGSGCKYAVKIISLNKFNFNGINAKRVDEALKEAELLQTLQHPSITALHEIFQTSTNIYIVMELVTGGELLDRIISKGKYEEGEAKTLVTNVLHAVEYLHKR
jgi:serine/threonine protein kinase